MKQGIDIHNYSRRLEGSVETLMKSKVSLRNKELILDFKGFCLVEGLLLIHKMLKLFFLS